MDPLALLGRKDKWSLAGGRGALYAPPFPKHLLAPGFWDPCFFGEIQIPRLFTAFVLNDRDRPIRFDSYHKGWRPDRLTIMHYSGDVVIRERRCVTEMGAFVSELELVTAVGPLHVVMVSMLPFRSGKRVGYPWQSIGEARFSENSIDIDWIASYPTRESIDSGTLVEGESIERVLSFGSSHARRSISARRTIDENCAPVWEATFLPQTFKGGRLDDVVSEIEWPLAQVHHFAQHYVLEDRRPIVLACGIGKTRDEANAWRIDAIQDDPLRRSESEWRAFLGQVPKFESSDPYLNAAYWYRWHVIRASTIERDGVPCLASTMPKRRVVHPRHPHACRETAWMRTPELASGILDTLLDSYAGRESLTVPSLREAMTQTIVLAGPSTWTDVLGRIRDRHGITIESARFDALRRVIPNALFNISVVEATIRTSIAMWFDEPDRNAIAERLMDRFFDEVNLILRHRKGNGDLSDAFFADGLAFLLIPGPVTDQVASDAVRRWIVDRGGFTRPHGWVNAVGEVDAYRSFDGDRDAFNSDLATSTDFLDILDAVAQRDHSLKPIAANFLMRSIHDRFLDGDPYRPHGYASFDPNTGDPALHTGLDMSVQGCLVDHILTSIVGVRGDRVDPLPVDVDWVQCEGIPSRGRITDVRWTRNSAPEVDVH